MAIATHKPEQGKFIESETVHSSNWYQTGSDTTPLKHDYQAWLEKSYHPSVDKYNTLKYFYANDEVITEYLYKIANRLLQNWPGSYPDIQIHFSAQRSYDATAFGNHNAIVVYRDLLTAAESEDELAAVLAHELAHILLEHQVNENVALARQYLIHNLKDANLLVSKISAIDVNKSSSGKKRLDVDVSGLKRDQRKIQAKATYLNMISSDLLSTPWNKAQEKEADLLAVDLLIAANYAPLELRKVVTRIRDSQKNNNTLVESILTEQQEIIKTQFSQLDEESLKDIEAEADKLTESLKSGLVDQAVSLVTKFDRPKPEERIKYLTEYLGGVYGHGFPRKTDRTSINTLRETNEVKQRLQNYLYADQAHSHLLNDELDKASQFGIKAVSNVTRDDHYTRYIMYKTRYNQGKVENSLKNINLMGKNALRPPSVFTELSLNDSAKQDYDSADEWLQAGIKEHGTSKPFIVEIVRLNTLRGNKQKVDEAMAECQSFKEIALTKRCREIVEGPGSSADIFGDMLDGVKGIFK